MERHSIHHPGAFLNPAGHTVSAHTLIPRYNKKLGIPDKWFTLGGSLIQQILGQLNSIPVLVLACRLCPKNIEGTMYALLMSILNLGALLSYQFGGILTHFLGITTTNFDNLWLLILICNISVLLPLPLVYSMEVDQA